MERIVGRATIEKREDDTFQTAIRRLRTFHKYHGQTLEWLREQHVPIVNLDCSGSADSVWDQLKAIGRLMRPAVKLPSEMKAPAKANSETKKAA
jgi:adenylate kinase family enzyme